MRRRGPIDWDAYRARYPRMTYGQVADFHRLVWRHFPDQNHHNAAAMDAFFAGIDARAVLEVGGWRGHAAARTLAAQPAIERWDNYEICEPAVLRPATSDPRYHGTWPARWPWELALPLEHDTAVLAHLIEHVTARQLTALVAWIAGNGSRHVYVESPLYDVPRSWRRHTSAHILEFGWDGVSALFAKHGFAVAERTPLGTGRAALVYRR